MEVSEVIEVIEVMRNRALAPRARCSADGLDDWGSDASGSAASPMRVPGSVAKSWGPEWAPAMS
jgi:hypothetical protein